MRTRFFDMRARSNANAVSSSPSLMGVPVMSVSSLRSSVLLRRASLLLAACFLWSLAVAPVLAASTVHVDAPGAHVSVQQRLIWRKQDEKIAAMKAHLSTFPYRQYALARTQALAPEASPAALPQALSLLDQSGRLVRPVNTAEVNGWKQSLWHNLPLKKGEAREGLWPPLSAPQNALSSSQTALSSSEAALLRLHLGEWELAACQNPVEAGRQFRLAQSLSTHADSLYGTAAFDLALAAYYRDSYAEATTDFRTLLAPKTALRGYDRRQCALWLREAETCAGYHAQHARLGIPEPVELDPQCGAAALASIRQSLGLSYDKKTILGAVKVTGEGSSLQDVLDGAGKLGMKAYALSADDQGLMALPKPLVAHVERDHFISVIQADKKGVSYLCSDCGMWPGGRVNLTWAQWHTMNPGVYAVACVRGGVWDQAIAAALRPASDAAPASSSSFAPSAPSSAAVQVASLRVAGLLRGQRVGLHLPSLARLRGDVLDLLPICRTRQIVCGSAGVTPQPPDPPEPPAPVVCLNQGNSVNVAMGQENHHPGTDLSVYNPVGPSVTWQRLYESLRGNGDGYYEGDRTYQCNDFGPGWTQNYNVGVSDPSAGGIGATDFKSILMADGSKLLFTASSRPTAASPTVHCVPVRSGFPTLLDWNYDGSPLGHYTVTSKNRTKWVTGGVIAAVNCYPLSQIVDRNGHAITFRYGAAPVSFDWPLLSSITNEAGTALLTIARATDGSGNIVSVTDCYKRQIFYHDGTFANAQVPKPWARTLQLLDRVSQIVPSNGTTTPPDLYVYGYTNLSNGNLSATTPGTYELIPLLTSCKTPSPTGTGQSTLTWNYDPKTDYITSESDGNGNVTAYTYGANSTIVSHQDSHGKAFYVETIGYDNNMNPTTDTDGAGRQTESPTYSDPLDPSAPSSITDANNHTTSYTWDQFGNKTSETSPRGTKTVYTYDYSQFALGELTRVQEGTKTATSVSYYEPSGLPQTVNVPQPGTSGTGAVVTSAFTYDGYGNVLTVVAPGNNAASTIKTTLAYTGDGTSVTSPSIGEPLAVTDNLGKVTHLRYDAQGQVVAVIDALGNETDTSYAEGSGGVSLGNQVQSVSLPATGQTGSGHGGSAVTYLYPGGPALSQSMSDESGRTVRQVTTTYGQEGETLSVSGSTEPVSYTYDALYRLTALTDGGSHVTRYFYKASGYLDTVTYPGYTGPVPVYSSSTDGWTNVSGPDSVRYPSYDAIGNLLSRVDGRGQTTAYAYNDAESLLTGITYPSGTLAGVSLSYDGYGRLSAMSDGTGSQTYAYDNSDALTAKTVTWPGLSAKTVSYSFYPDGSRAGMTADGQAFSYGYDAVGRPTNLANASGEQAAWSYRDNGWLQSKVLGNSANATVATTAYTQNVLGQVTDLLNRAGGGATLSRFSSMAYDGAGNRTAVTASLPGAPAAYSGTTGYTYDGGQTNSPALSRSQLTGETSSRATGTLSYAYDGGSGTGPGNPTSFKGAANTFNADNQVTNAGYAYDGAGNPTTYKTAALTFDPENRMTSYAGTVQTDGYSGDDLRAWKQSAGSKTYFLYDGTQPVCEYSGTGTLLASNTFGADGLVSRHTSAGSIFYTFDERGNVAQRLSSTGAVQSSDLYDAYGASRLTW